jgi:hypothetical protein
MKKNIKISLLAFLLVMALGNIGFAQEHVKLERNKTVHLKNESNITLVQVNVSKEFNFLKFVIRSQFTSGEVVVELMDPDENIKGNYTIKSDKNTPGKNTSVSESVTGEMEKAFRNPTPGDWTIHIKPTNATGKIEIYSKQIFNPRADMLELFQIEEEAETKIN